MRRNGVDCWFAPNETLREKTVSEASASDVARITPPLKGSLLVLHGSNIRLPWALAIGIVLALNRFKYVLGNFLSVDPWDKNTVLLDSLQIPSAPIRISLFYAFSVQSHILDIIASNARAPT
jgi:hypothetical protein